VLQQFENLRSDFIKEAKGAPNLFKDLAKLEQYIAESYKTRSLIELIQNADDAQSTRFGIHRSQKGFVVGNNGDPFTIQDIESLCRSGSSNKVRGGDTIGYRGIGFKSVVNIARRILIFSGDFSFFYDKTETKKLFPDLSNVPLIRIPHLLNYDTNSELFDSVNSVREQYSYQTLFIFQELNDRLSLDEFSNFDRSCLLFLNNLKHIEFRFQEVKRKIAVEAISTTNQCTVCIRENDIEDEWELFRSKTNPKDVLAFKKSNENIVSASPEESLIHSFTPTTVFTGAYFKINGDYSTDPSRKSIDMDESSKASYANAISLLADIIILILNRELSKPGFFTIFNDIKTVENVQWKSLLFKSLRENLQNRTIKYSSNREVLFHSLRIRPEWVTYEDYESLCQSDISCIPKELLLLYPNVTALLEELAIEKLKLKEVIEKVNSAKLSIVGAAQILAKIIKQYQFDLTEEKAQRIRSLNIFPTDEKFETAGKISSYSQLNKQFFDFLCKNCDPKETRSFFRKMKIEFEHNTLAPKKIEMPQKNPCDFKGNKFEKQGFKSTPNIKKWRSAEMNAKEYITALEGVLSVTDVSKAHMGWDLEVLLNNGKKIYAEVKSVSSVADTIRITNNEYASAHNYGDSYCLVIVINCVPIEIKIIIDPVNKINLEKRIEKWTWICDSYSQELEDIQELTNF
jgi:hypothetical protein